MVIQLYRRLDSREALKIKGEQTGAKIEEEPNNGYLTRWMPRFSEGIKDEDPLRDDVIKVFCVFKR